MSSIVINVSGDLHMPGMVDQGKLDEVLAKLTNLGIQITAQGELIVASNAELVTLLEEANTATNEIADDLAEIIAQLGDVPAETLAKAQALVDKLKGVAAVVPEPESPPA